MAAGALGRLDYALFAAAAQHAGAATTTVLFEMWPLVMVLMVPAQSRYRAAGWMLMASAGVPMVVLGYNSDISSGGSWTGAALGLAAAFLAGCAVAADLAAGGALHTRYERRSDQQRTNATLGLLAQQTVRVAQRRWLAVACALVACAVIAPSSAPSNSASSTATTEVRCCGLRSGLPCVRSVRYKPGSRQRGRTQRQAALSSPRSATDDGR